MRQSAERDVALRQEILQLKQIWSVFDGSQFRFVCMTQCNRSCRPELKIKNNLSGFGLFLIQMYLFKNKSEKHTLDSLIKYCTNQQTSKIRKITTSTRWECTARVLTLIWGAKTHFKTLFKDRQRVGWTNEGRVMLPQFRLQLKKPSQLSLWVTFLGLAGEASSVTTLFLLLPCKSEGYTQ